MGGNPAFKGPRDRDGNPVGESKIQGNVGLGNYLLSQGVDLKTDLEAGFLQPNADGSPINDTRPGKGPTNPATGKREPSMKGVVNPFGPPRKTEPDFDFTIGFTPKNLINDSDNFAIAAASQQTNPSQGASNALFDNIRKDLPEEPEVSVPSDAEISAIANTGLVSGDDDESIRQLKV